MDRITAARVFITIVERGSMIAAAEQLEMSRAMVTRYLSQMEEWTGARLLHRTTRRLSLTDAGERTLALSRKMLEVAEAIDQVEERPNDEIRGILRITCSQSLGQTALAGAVTQYLKLHPQVAVDLQMNNRAVNLVEERIDLALRITNDLDPNLIARPLSSCASVVCAAPRYLAERGTPERPEDLAGHNCLTYSWFGKSLWHFERAGEKSSVAVSGNLSANESVVLLAGTLRGAGISLQPYYSAAPQLAKGELVELLPAYKPQAMGIYGIYTSRKQMPATLRSMLDFLVEWFASDAQWRATLR
jgi:DNA-binding transcriptional LysR family regulator